VGGAGKDWMRRGSSVMVVATSPVVNYVTTSIQSIKHTNHSTQCIQYFYTAHMPGIRTFSHQTLHDRVKRPKPNLDMGSHCQSVVQTIEKESGQNAVNQLFDIDPPLFLVFGCSRQQVDRS
jgi:hypothetical protein